jgi:hypothetical protein
MPTKNIRVTEKVKLEAWTLFHWSPLQTPKIGFTPQSMFPPWPFLNLNRNGG